MEASDVDNLFDQFEASTDLDGVDEDDEFDDFDDPETASTIMAAVHNHFASSEGNKDKKNPRIGESNSNK